MHKRALFLAAALAAAPAAAGAQEGRLAAADSTGAIYTVTGRFNNRNDYLRIIKLKANGDLLWEADYNDGTDKKPVSVAAHAAGIVILASARINDSRSFTLVNYAAGNYPLWERQSGAYDTVPVSVITDRDGGIYVCGNTRSGSRYRAALWKFDRGGVPLWHTEYDAGENSYAQQLQVLFDGNIALGVTVVRGSANYGQYERRALIYTPNGAALNQPGY